MLRLLSFRLILGLLWMGVALVCDAGGVPLPGEPILRVESVMHNSIIRRIGVDAKETVLASVSDDKTLRIWSLADGELKKVLRVPIGKSSDGKLFALAVSPDGSMAAVGGWTGWDWDNSISIYVFDLEQGHIRLRISGLANTINHLVFSDDGRYLVAMLAKGLGMRVFNAQNGDPVASDSEYGDHSYWADFNQLGQLVTASYDGLVRLYDNEFNLIHKKQVHAEDQPFSVAWAPDGKKIAVGFRRGGEVRVISGNDLEPLYTPDHTGVSKKLHAVAWSPDGNYLYGAGLHFREHKRLIRRWANGGVPIPGETLHADFAAAEDTIMQLIPLSGGRVVFAAADPSLGMLDEEGGELFFHDRPIPIFRGIGGGFKVSKDGAEVQFSYDANKGRLARFSARELATQLGGDPGAQLKPPIVTAEGVELSGWKERSDLLLNGKELALKRHEVPQAVAITPDGGSFLVGTSFYLRHFNLQGEELWKVAAPATVWGVNVSGDNRFVVAAFGDGVIRWYLLESGRQMLALFPANGGGTNEWVVWTAKGYYATSANGGGLIGWHKNQGKGYAASFYPSENFKYVYYRPDVIKALFAPEEKDQVDKPTSAVSSPVLSTGKSMGVP